MLLFCYYNIKPDSTCPEAAEPNEQGHDAQPDGHTASSAPSDARVDAANAGENPGAPEDQHLSDL